MLIKRREGPSLRFSSKSRRRQPSIYGLASLMFTIWRKKHQASSLWRTTEASWTKLCSIKEIERTLSLWRIYWLYHWKMPFWGIKRSILGMFLSLRSGKRKGIRKCSDKLEKAYCGMFPSKKYWRRTTVIAFQSMLGLLQFSKPEQNKKERKALSEGRESG